MSYLRCLDKKEDGEIVRELVPTGGSAATTQDVKSFFFLYCFFFVMCFLNIPFFFVNNLSYFRWLDKKEDDGEIVRELAPTGGSAATTQVVKYKILVHTGDKRGAGYAIF